MIFHIDLKYFPKRLFEINICYESNIAYTVHVWRVVIAHGQICTLCILMRWQLIL